jgi:anti-sigma28 factor (negative regulator of flagellin synthesis)
MKEKQKPIKKKEGEFLKLKKVAPVELRMFVREMLIPELKKAIEEGEFRIPQKAIE